MIETIFFKLTHFTLYFSKRGQEIVTTQQEVSCTERNTTPPHHKYEREAEPDFEKKILLRTKKVMIFEKLIKKSNSKLDKHSHKFMIKKKR